MSRETRSHKTAAFDGGEQVSLMEPMIPSEGGSMERELSDLAVDLIARANRLAGLIHPVVRSAVGGLVRSMNCYYSNLIEGHNTHPADIARALREDYSADSKKRDLQKEAKAHIEIQAMVDASDGALPAPSAGLAFVRAVHREFCSRLPDEFLWAENPGTHERLRVVPGELRDRLVKIGRHVPPSPGALTRFLARFEEAYNSPTLGKVRQVIAAGAAHHRILWIHPFLDGNGRVARLLSHAMLRDLGIGTSLWSVARGLARQQAEYRGRLMAADEERAGAHDGRGARTERGLSEFCAFFLRTCIDQVEFMEELLAPETLLRRVELWCEEESRAGRLPAKCILILREAIHTGKVERGRLAVLTGLGERHARAVASKLVERRILAAPTHRAPLTLNFPLEVVERWFPSLYPTR